MKFRPRKCKYCGQEYIPTSSSNLYCSAECAANGVIQRHYKKSYGLSYKEVIDLREKQGNVCAICGKPGFMMNDRVKSGLNVDHDHETGKIRGMLCHNCNRAIGLFQDDINLMKAAINYLEGATTIPIGSTAKRLEAHDTDDNQ